MNCRPRCSSSRSCPHHDVMAQVVRAPSASPAAERGSAPSTRQSELCVRHMRRFARRPRARSPSARQTPTRGPWPHRRKRRLQLCWTALPQHPSSGLSTTQRGQCELGWSLQEALEDAQPNGAP
eukprot:Amastigsp_a510506_21.p1 type:complete len:124 gc:universal Amastigsp_a510506_21:202-573(+)